MVKKLKKAFTITELVIVIAVIAILAAVLIPTLSNVVASANKSAALSTCHNAMTDLVGKEAGDGGTSEDLEGTVFVSNGYAYILLNNSLQYVGELEDLSCLDSDGKCTQVGDVSTINSVTVTKNTSYTTLALALDTETMPVATTSNTTLTICFTNSTTENAATYTYNTAAVENSKSAEYVYIYKIVDSTNNTYYGFFTYEASTAYYTSESAVYSRVYGYTKSLTEITLTATAA